MGTTQSTLQIPVEESLFPPGQTQYSLRDAIDNDNSLLRSRFGYRIDTTAETTTHQFYHCTSGRMMKTFPLRRTGSNNNNTSPLGPECTAVVKATWILEQPMAEPSTSPEASSTQPSIRTTTWLEDQVQELQRIRHAVAHLPHVAPYRAWFLSEPLKSRNVVPNVARVPHLQRYYGAPTSSYSSSSLTSGGGGGGTPSNVSVRAVYLLRAAVYTTLADRLASRPWLTTCEKLWITHQLLEALQQLHDQKVVHGFLTTENIGLTSTGYVVLLDISSYKARTRLPDDDPSEFLYYFQPQSTTTTTTTTNTNLNRRTINQSSSEKRCYLAPERFFTPSSSSSKSSEGGTAMAPSSSSSSEPPLTPAMDIFSLGCVIAELFLNGERCWDLGDIMEYRRLNAASGKGSTVLPASWQQKLHKVESSAIRAMCKHMWTVDPQERRSAREYWEGLRAADRFPLPAFTRLTWIAEQMVTGECTSSFSREADPAAGVVESTTTTNLSMLSPDARMTLLAMEYSNVLWDTMGVRDAVGEAYMRNAVGPTLLRRTASGMHHKPPGRSTALPSEDEEPHEEPDAAPLGSTGYTQKLWASVEGLLQELDAIPSSSENDESASTTKPPDVALSGGPDIPAVVEERSDLAKSTLLIFLQMVLSTVRHAQRPTTKLIALQLVGRLSMYSSDETRLQRIVPITISLLNDQDPLVRASAVQVLSSTLSAIDTFPPSDAKVFPQYIFKRIAHLISDPAFVVRLAFAGCMAELAETARRFLDISHAVRLYEAVGNGTSGSISRDEMVFKVGGEEKAPSTAVFGDEVVQLLDKSSRVSSGISLASEPLETMADPSSANSESASVASVTTLISSTYNSELAGLHETVSRWVVYIATDQSEHGSLPKRAILKDLNRFCSFFGLEGAMSFILPQVLAFLNERKDWELRASLFEHLPSVCQCIGRAATEEFVLPCIEIGLVDSEEGVICASLSCLAKIARMGLLSRFAIIGNASQRPSIKNQSLLKKYGPLLVFPSDAIRRSAINAFVSISIMIGVPDCNVFIFPLLCPFFRGRPDFSILFTEDSFRESLKPAWTRNKVVSTLDEIKSSERSMLWTPGAWTSIGVTVCDDKGQGVKPGSDEIPDSTIQKDPEELSMKEYLKMLSKHSTQTSTQDRSLTEKFSTSLTAGIEASGKLAQSIMFPKQNSRFKSDFLPEWYVSLRETVERTSSDVSESVSIRSVSSLGRIYGLSIMGIEGVTKNELVALDDVTNTELAAQSVLRSTESASIEGAFNGEWGSESILDPEIIDTTYLVTKLKALNVPPLPLNLGDPYVTKAGYVPATKDFNVAAEWKPRMKSLLATSNRSSGHTAPVTRLAVSMDQIFFVSASHDGTCRVWDTSKMEESGGLLDTSFLYTEHSNKGSCRVNDIAMLEGTYSVVSGASDGSVHIWRVDMVNATGQTLYSNDSSKYRRPRAVGSTVIRTIDPQEGEILAVSHFNSSFGSIITYGTQLGIVHSWDLRCSLEPFRIQHSPEMGYLTSLALGSDRNWIISGTSRGYIALWDIRFQQCLKLWRHSRDAPIVRLATATVPPPDHWGSVIPSSSARPFIFSAAGVNECSMFDVFSGRCTECFRTVIGDNRNLNSHVQDPPDLLDIPFTTNRRSGMLKPTVVHDSMSYTTSFSSINCMAGSVGAGNHSYLITGGSDGRIRYWDFATPSKCFVISGLTSMHSRPTYERIDFEGQRRLMLCRQAQHGLREFNKSPNLINRRGIFCKD